MSTMHMVTVACAIAAAVLAGSTAAQAAEGSGPAMESTAPVKVVCFGDSITEGDCASDPATKPYPAVLQTLLDAKYGKGKFIVKNAGISGQDTRKGLARLDALIAQESPDWILMEYGTNDIWTSRNMAPSQTKDNLTEMIRRMKAARVNVIMATLPPASGNDVKIAERNVAIEQVAADTGVHLIDLNAILEKAMADAGGRDKRSSWEKYYTDENEFLHPNDFGYAFLAGEWLKALDAAMGKGASKDAGK